MKVWVPTGAADARRRPKSSQSTTEMLTVKPEQQKEAHAHMQMMKGLFTTLASCPRVSSSRRPLTRGKVELADFHTIKAA